MGRFDAAELAGPGGDRLLRLEAAAGAGARGLHRRNAPGLRRLVRRDDGRAGSDETESILAALLIELPLALVLFATATILLRMSLRRTVALAGGEGIPRLRDLPLFGVSPRPD